MEKNKEIKFIKPKKCAVLRPSYFTSKNKKLEVIKNKVPKVQIKEKDEVILNGKKLERGKDYTIDIKTGAVELNRELLSKMKNQKEVSYSSYVYREIKGKNVEK